MTARFLFGSRGFSRQSHKRLPFFSCMPYYHNDMTHDRSFSTRFAHPLAGSRPNSPLRAQTVGFVPAASANLITKASLRLCSISLWELWLLPKNVVRSCIITSGHGTMLRLSPQTASEGGKWIPIRDICDRRHLMSAKHEFSTAARRN